MTDNPFEPPDSRAFESHRNRPLRAHGYDNVPGPGRKRHKRHFASQDLIGWWMIAIVIVVPFLIFCWTHR